MFKVLGIRWFTFLCFLFFQSASCSDWMAQQIDADLSPWKSCKIPRSKIKEAFTRSQGRQALLVHVIIKDGTWHFSPEEDAWNVAPHNTPIRLRALEKHLPMLCEGRKFNCEFLLTLHDRVQEDLQLGVPVFGFAKKTDNLNAVCLPDFESLQGRKNLRVIVKNRGAMYPWQCKQEKAFWRGATTGGFFNIDNCLDYPRSKLVMISVAHPQAVDARFTKYTQRKGKGVLEKLMDNCPLAPHVSPGDHLQYKYLVNVDGNSCAYSRMFWILYSNSLLMKQETDHVQWYYRALMPWYHYVPLLEDLSDLVEKIDWAKENDTLCQEMSIRATDLANDVFSVDSMREYVCRLLEAYSECLAID